MGWLRYGLQLEEELEVEKAARNIRTCDDVEKLQKFAEETYRAWCLQMDITDQLIRQVADAEARLARYEPIDTKFLEMAREISGQAPADEPAPGLLHALRCWFRGR